MTALAEAYLEHLRGRSLRLSCNRARRSYLRLDEKVLDRSTTTARVGAPLSHISRCRSSEWTIAASIIEPPAGSLFPPMTGAPASPRMALSEFATREEDPR